MGLDIVGIDEVGRGCWAGPLLVVAARAKDSLPPGLRDSKLLSKIQRQKHYDSLVKVCDFGEGWVTPVEIDKIGLTKALSLGAERALTSLRANHSIPIILDGSHNYLPINFINVTNFPKADNLEPIVSAASIYAKVSRDNFMLKLAEKYCLYGFDRHVGYGTKAHLEALKSHGAISGIHRFSFKPVAELV